MAIITGESDWIAKWLRGAGINVHLDDGFVIEIDPSNYTDSLGDWLKANGLYSDHIHRIKIEVRPNDVVSLHMWHYGTVEMFEGQPPDLSGADITILEKGDGRLEDRGPGEGGEVEQAGDNEDRAVVDDHADGAA